MSFDSLLRHRIVIKRLVNIGTFDDYGQPIFGPTTVASDVHALIQPRPPGEEVVITTQAGAVISKHVGYLRMLVGLGTDCWIELAGVRFDILDMPDAGGQGHHLELPLLAVT